MRVDLAALAPALAYTALLTTAATYDIVQRRIPNWTVLGLLVLFIPTTWLGYTPTTWPWSIAAFCVALAGSGALYLMGMIGAGDAKLFSATSLFAGLSNLLLLFVATTLVGGALALGMLILRPKSAMRALTKRGRGENGKRGVPYGVAIAAGAMIAGYITHFAAPHYYLEHLSLPTKLTVVHP